MANKKFTEQEMLTLRNSKYVLDVSPSIVHFSAEFKKLFWEELSKGRLPREILSTLGIDPNILGDSRINGLKTMIGNEVKKGNGFRDLNTYAQGCNGYLYYMDILEFCIYHTIQYHLQIHDHMLHHNHKVRDLYFLFFCS